MAKCNESNTHKIEILSASEIYSKLECHKQTVIEALSEITDLDIASKSLIYEYLNNTAHSNQSSLLKIQALIDHMYEQINIGNWKEVKMFLRKTVTVASFVKLLLHTKLSVFNENCLKESFKIIDFGLLFGCPLERDPKLLHHCASLFNSLSRQLCKSDDDSFSSNENEITYINKNRLNCQNIEVIECPSMEYFYRNYIVKEQPVVLCNCISHWPALTKWRNPNYFKNIAGSRTVPIELGRVYTDSDWTQKLMTMDEFIDQYIYQCNGPTGYLAQYQLFEQIPELKNDISEPEYCCFSDTNEAVDIMAWFGPKGTISALHHDPKKNLLSQVVGEKQLYLFSPKASEFLYPHSHELLNNTAQVDPREPDFDKYPLFKNAEPYYCILKPGQMLYIPPKWWHFVESLSMSFSVSFWWD